MWQIMANLSYVVHIFLTIFRGCELGTVQLNTEWLLCLRFDMQSRKSVIFKGCYSHIGAKYRKALRDILYFRRLLKLF